MDPPDESAAIVTEERGGEERKCGGKERSCDSPGFASGVASVVLETVNGDFHTRESCLQS